MKRTFLVTVALLVCLVAADIASNSALSQAFHYWTLNVRTLLAVTGKVTVGDSLRVNKELIIPTNGKITVFGGTVAGIDSFPTTVATDTLAISGVAVGDIFAITEYLPTWDAVGDTSILGYQALTDKLVVNRDPASPTGVLKSAGKYSYIRLNK